MNSPGLSALLASLLLAGMTVAAIGMAETVGEEGASGEWLP